MEVATVKPLHKQATTPAVHMGWKNPRPIQGAAHATSVVNKMHISQTSQKITNSKIVRPINKHRRMALYTEVCISCSLIQWVRTGHGILLYPCLQQHRVQHVAVVHFRRTCEISNKDHFLHSMHILCCFCATSLSIGFSILFLLNLINNYILCTHLRCDGQIDAVFCVT